MVWIMHGAKPSDQMYINDPERYFFKQAVQQLNQLYNLCVKILSKRDYEGFSKLVARLVGEVLSSLKTMEKAVKYAKKHRDVNKCFISRMLNLLKATAMYGSQEYPPIVVYCDLAEYITGLAYELKYALPDDLKPQINWADNAYKVFSSPQLQQMLKCILLGQCEHEDDQEGDQ